MYWLADLILIVHIAFVSFVVGGLALVWIGAAAGWRWVRDFRFRIAHLCATCFVAAESLLGVICPLTQWEDRLRGDSAESGFIARWIHRILFYRFPEWVFTSAYVLFALAVALTLWLIPPRRHEVDRHDGSSRHC